MTETITTIGLDVHKMSISVAVAGPDVGPEAVFIGEIANRPREIAGMLGKLAARHGALALCYEAGPCGYGSIAWRSAWAMTAWWWRHR